MADGSLSGIIIYPIKSMGGIEVSGAAVEDRGLRLDRRWMLVDANGVFITQREHPRMALVAITVEDDGLICTAPGWDDLFVPITLTDPQTLSVTIWRSTCLAQRVGREADAWFSAFLETSCHLVYMPESTRRSVSADHAIADDIVSFADGYPFLLIGEASLADLNDHLEQPVLMNRFRPNLVIDGTAAFAEDTWKVVRIGDITFHVVKPCGRCVITTVDQAMGRFGGKDPLKTLARYRTWNHNAMFGQNLIGAGTGTLRVGDPLVVVETKPARD